jgi:hypothetical protein
LYFLPDNIRVIKVRCVKGAGHGEDENCIQNFGWKVCRKRPLGRCRYRWEDYMKMDLREIWFGGVGWIIWLWIGISGGLL